MHADPNVAMMAYQFILWESDIAKNEILSAKSTAI